MPPMLATTSTQMAGPNGYCLACSEVIWRTAALFSVTRDEWGTEADASTMHLVSSRPAAAAEVVANAIAAANIMERISCPCDYELTKQRNTIGKGVFCSTRCGG